MNHSRCAKCGCKLSEGDLKYHITIEIIPEYGNLLSELQEEILGDFDMILHQIGEPEGGEGEVYEEISFILCKACTGYFSKDPMGDSSRYISQKMGPSHLLH